jgi:hypothetical protein
MFAKPPLRSPRHPALPAQWSRRFRRFDRDANWIAAGAGDIDLFGGVVPGHTVAGGDDGVCELAQIERVLGGKRLGSGGLGRNAARQVKRD